MSLLPVPSPRTWTAGEFATAAELNALRDAINFMLNLPVASLYQATSQSFSNGIWAAVGLDATVQDTYGGHSNSTNNTRYVAQVAGTYEVCGTIAWPSNSTGARGCRLAKNGTAITGAATFTGTTTGDVYAITTPAFHVQMVVGDFVETHGFQSSGGALSSNVAAADIRASMNVRWVHA